MAPTNLLQSIQGSARDFRKTLFLLFGIFVAGSVIGFLNSLAVIDYLYNVSDKIGILEIHPAEGFLNRFKIAFLIGLIITMPFIFFTLIDLVKRKFPRLGIKNSYLVTAVCYALFMVGALFAFFFIIPLAIDILAGYGGPSTEATYSIGKYVNFVAILTFVFGLSFEMPVVIIAHSYARVIKSKSLIKNRRYMILLIFIAAALVTPPDPLSLMLLASPLLVLYEISIIFARIRDRSLDKAVTPTFTKSGQMVMPKGYEEASKIKTQEALAEIGLTMEDMEKMGNQMISALKHHDPEPEPEPEPEPDYDKNE